MLGRPLALYDTELPDSLLHARRSCHPRPTGQTEREREDSWVAVKNGLIHCNSIILHNKVNSTRKSGGDAQKRDRHRRERGPESRRIKPVPTKALTIFQTSCTALPYFLSVPAII